MARKYVPRSRLLQKGDNISPKKYPPKVIYANGGQQFTQKRVPLRPFWSKGDNIFPKFIPLMRLSQKGDNNLL